MFTTAALFGGAGCSVLHVHTAADAVFVYYLAVLAALAVMVPWFLADTLIDWLRARSTP